MTNKKKRFSLTNQIFFALIAGALTGVILNIVSAGQHIGFINNWLISGLFEIVGKMFISAI
ncbi:MAG TPA: dicarboxylate/amino acid:cation symporter, partial [bacterium]|nr:dicarboxylate/amino acid:cation symporter [bacterium]